MESLTIGSMLNDDQPHPLGDLVRGFVEFCELKKYTCIGIGERMHGVGILEDVFIAYLLPTFVKVGYKTLIVEALFKDAEPELESIYKLLDGWRQYLLIDRVSRLRGEIKEGSSFPILKYNYSALLSGLYKIDILALIITAHALGVKLHGMICSNQLVSDIYLMPQIIADGGREQANRLKKNGKLLIYCGDMHVVAKQLEIVYLNPNYKTPGRLSFGRELYMDEGIKYLHLTLLGGTVESIKKANSDPKIRVFEQGGIHYYLERFAGLRPGMARYNFIEQEGERRGILLYNNSFPSS